MPWHFIVDINLSWQLRITLVALSRTSLHDKDGYQLKQLFFIIQLDPVWNVYSRAGELPFADNSGHSCWSISWIVRFRPCLPRLVLVYCSQWHGFCCEIHILLTHQSVTDLPQLLLWMTCQVDNMCCSNFLYLTKHGFFLSRSSWPRSHWCRLRSVPQWQAVMKPGTKLEFLHRPCVFGCFSFYFSLLYFYINYWNLRPYYSFVELNLILPYSREHSLLIIEAKRRIYALIN